MRERLEPDRRSADLIKIGLKIFAKTSFNSISVSEIAKRAGTSKGLLFHYFPTKEDYYVALLNEASLALIALTDKSAHLAGPKRLAKIIADLVDWVEEHPGLYQMLVRSDLGNHPQVRKVHDKKRRHYQEVILNSVLGEKSSSIERDYQFLGATAYVESILAQWIDARNLDKPQVHDILIKGVKKILLGR